MVFMGWGNYACMGFVIENPDRIMQQGKKKNCFHQGINIPFVAVSVSIDLTVSILRETGNEVNPF